jgi:SAM-dependent methyltransferase
MRASSDPPSVGELRAYYDQRWLGYDHANRLQLERAIAVLDGLARTGRRSPRILDHGCGTGWLSAILGRFGPTTGLDLSQVGIDRARAMCADVEFRTGDLLASDLPHGSFDVVVSVQVLDHMTDQARYVDIVADLLVPGGHLILLTTNAWNFDRWTAEARERFAGKPQPVESWVTPPGLRRLVARRFRVRRLWTILPVFGDRGLCRVVGSAKLNAALRAVGLRRAYERIVLRLGLGLVVALVAERKPGTATVFRSETR